MQFRLISENEPKGDQPEAIEQLVRNLNEGAKDQVLLGITGSGKTFTIAKVIEQVQRPTLRLDLARIPWGVGQALAQVARYRPYVIVSTRGCVWVPPVFAGRL